MKQRLCILLVGMIASVLILAGCKRDGLLPTKVPGVLSFQSDH
jgi:hypothetical protein